ncbi:MAG: hypothetical protein ACRDBH_02000 [Bosea sp. (in: a-proteobacteria)]
MNSPHTHTHSHSSGHAHVHGQEHVHYSPAPIAPGWSLLRLSVPERLALVALPLALLWAATFVLIR